jgi:cytochrome c oxidase cbb3-type subunit 2
MSSPSCTSFCRGVLAALVVVCASRVAAAGPVEDFRRHCATCHGLRGNGQGPSAAFLEPRPRDFTKGAFKFRSTASGALPSDRDLLAVVTDGLRGTSMPGFRRVLPLERRRALVDVVKGFSPRFRVEAAPAPLHLPASTPADAGTLSRGRAVYERMQCVECHGRAARGDGPSVPTLVDDAGRPIVPSDLTRRDMIRRRSTWGMMRVMYTGLDGTPMPSYADVITPAESWDLVRWLVSLQDLCTPWTAFFLDPPLVWRGHR